MAQTAELNVVTPPTTRWDVELRNVSKSFGSDRVVQDLTLQIRQGEFFSILGPSGCGKTTTLRLIAGFEFPSSGDITIRNQSMQRVPPFQRPVNTVFQSYALFGHMTIWDNVAFGLKIQNCNRSDLQSRVAEALSLVKMDHLARRMPGQLSGGQQQRVALARALVNRPAVMLLDEPLGALDLKLRKEMQLELATLHRELGMTFIMVTHDQEEALALSDRVAVMNQGRLEQVGSPSEIYDRPQSPFVADFIGDTNLLAGRIESGSPGDSTRSDALQICSSNGLQLQAAARDLAPGTRDVVVSVRPEAIGLASEPPHPDAAPNCFAGRLCNQMYLGTHVQYLVELPSGDRLRVHRPTSNRLVTPVRNPDRGGDSAGDAIGASMGASMGESVYVYWSAQDCLALAA
jgi:spermidine/putrescine transport system ATP-binding protein